MSNRCIVCKEDLGIHNMRQLCMKTYCPLQFSLISVYLLNDRESQ